MQIFYLNLVKKLFKNMSSLFVVSALSIAPAFALPVFGIKENTTFHAAPNGKTVSIPDGSMLFPFLDFDYSETGVDGWCKYKILTGRGAPASTSVAWIKCDQVGPVVGNM